MADEQQQLQQQQGEALQHVQHVQPTSDEIFFTNVFNAHRSVLTGFSHCSNRTDLHLIRDAFFLGMASDLCPNEYEPVRNRIVLDPRVAAVAAVAQVGGGTSSDGIDATKGSGTDGTDTDTTTSSSNDALTRTVESARKSPAWDHLITTVKAKAYEVGSDLDEIWMTLENGRMEWLNAASSAHGIKVTLRSALDSQCGGMPTDGDTSDAMMIWMYALSLNIPSLEKERVAWQRVVKMDDPTRPLVGYNAELWDARKEEWRPLDLGVQAAAERGGSSLQEAWKA